jgi:hypothetical protein
MTVFAPIIEKVCAPGIFCKAARSLKSIVCTESKVKGDDIFTELPEASTLSVAKTRFLICLASYSTPAVRS